ncbi:hypothetical protein SAMN04488040_2826 [Sulfitobacter marinus]|uniref:Arginine transporter n=1 Tax=Sulfitobacter marinus TaxID=394264 RepID=A0A1I6ULN8_9RHOB|nr:hypothetical protein [Sulfitobacter marinus]SFT02274.1 hypothetical protein SAMN04488040_2826 [Sulfitobacter marinus]
MLRIFTMICALSALAACGGGRGYNPGGGYRSAPVLFATGPIQSACMSAGRKQASRSRCGCIQAVADRSLSPSEQRRGVQVFKDPHTLQEARQSDSASDNAFWSTWKAFGNTAETLCSAA